MINRDNWLDTKKYLEYLHNVLQLDDKTIKRRREQLRHLLEWAGSKPFSQARNIDPTFAVFLLTSRYDGKEKSLSPETMKATCNVVRHFFEWVRMEMPRKYPRINPSWIDTIRPARSRGMQTTVKNHEFYTLDEMRLITAYQPETLLEERDRAAMAFVFLSGMRADAFVSLPISCVDIKNLTVDQYPEMGVRTKNHKAAKTYLLPIPELVTICQIWDEKVRSQLPESAMWFSSIAQNGDDLVALLDPTVGRREKLTDGLTRICAKARVKYKSPHKLRHGHVVYGVKLARNLEELKAISQNVMHANVEITDRVYSQLAGDDVRRVISTLFPKFTSEAIDMDAQKGLEALAAILKEHPGLLDALKKGES